MANRACSLELYSYLTDEQLADRLTGFIAPGSGNFFPRRVLDNLPTGSFRQVPGRTQMKDQQEIRRANWKFSLDRATTRCYRTRGARPGPAIPEVKEKEARDREGEK